MWREDERQTQTVHFVHSFSDLLFFRSSLHFRRII